MQKHDDGSLCYSCNSARQKALCVSRFCLDCCNGNGHGSECQPTQINFGAIQAQLNAIAPIKPAQPLARGCGERSYYNHQAYADNRRTRVRVDARQYYHTETHNHYYAPAQPQQQVAAPQYQERYQEPEAAQRPQPTAIPARVLRRQQVGEEVRREREALALRDESERQFVRRLIAATGNIYSVDEVLGDADLFRTLTLEVAAGRR